MFEHRAGCDLAHSDVLQAKSGDQAIERDRQHVLVRGSCVRTVGPSEGNAVAADDSGAAKVRHYSVCVLCGLNVVMNGTDDGGGRATAQVPRWPLGLNS